MKPKQLRSSLPPAKPSAAAQHGILNLVARGRIDEAAATLGSSGLSLTVSDPAGDDLKMLGLSEHQLSLLQALGRYASAAEQSPARWYALGDLELLAARPAKAIDAFRACLHLSPGHVGTLLRLAKSLRAVGRKGEAVAALQRATALAPGSGKAHNEAGQIYLERPCRSTRRISQRFSIWRTVKNRLVTVGTRSPPTPWRSNLIRGMSKR